MSPTPLNRLIDGLPVTLISGIQPDLVSQITDDSRQVNKGALFVAIPGTAQDGRDYIANAVKAGAAAILTEVNEVAKAQAGGVPLLHSDAPRIVLAQLAARFYAPQPGCQVAVTGTDGKTSVAHFTRQLWEKCGLKAASIGTIGIRGDDVPSSVATEHLENTTLGPVMLHQTLQQLAQAGVQHVALEASSHGIHQHRLDGMALKAAAFTNLSRDHLDYHGTMEAYFAAKADLFTRLLPKEGLAVIHGDTEYGQQMAGVVRSAGRRLLLTGEAEGANIRMTRYQPHATGADVVFHWDGEEAHLSLPLCGRFQIWNVMVAGGLASVDGLSPHQILPQISQLSGVPGRMESVAHTPSGANVLVDYAHTLGALEQVLKSVRPHVEGKLIVVFGCGGDRDPGKRAPMGKVAGELADHVIITNDNPRTEDAAAIRQMVRSGVAGDVPVVEEGDRAEAIAIALEVAQRGDVVLIAGKGHEDYQIIGTEKQPFCDRTVVRNLLGAGAREMA